MYGSGAYGRSELSAGNLNISTVLSLENVKYVNIVIQLDILHVLRTVGVE